MDYQQTSEHILVMIYKVLLIKACNEWFNDLLRISRVPRELPRKGSCIMTLIYKLSVMITSTAEKM